MLRPLIRKMLQEFVSEKAIHRAMKDNSKTHKSIIEKPTHRCGSYIYTRVNYLHWRSFDYSEYSWIPSCLKFAHMVGIRQNRVLAVVGVNTVCYSITISDYY